MKIKQKKLIEFIDRKEHKALLLELPEEVWRDYTEKTDIWLEQAFKEVEMEAYETQAKADDRAIEILKLRIRDLEKKLKIE